MVAWAADGDKAEKDAKSASDAAIAKQLNSRVFFLSAGGKDPSDEFMKRFSDFPRRTAKASAAKQTKGPMGGWVVDRKTKEPGNIFSADEIQWKSDTEVEVNGGYHCGGLCASGEVFTVILENHKWAVTKSIMHWIS